MTVYARRLPRPTEPRRSREISPEKLESIAHALGLTIDLPPAVGGWARLTTPRGTRYHAWVPAVTA